MTLSKQMERLTADMIYWRRHLHANPELSFQEQETSRFVAKELEKIPGMRVDQRVGYPTAVVGMLSSSPGPTIAIRADMDALPIQEQNDVTYKSKRNSVMHACGHDAHTAIVLGVAKLLSKYFQKGLLQGTVKFLFQPAEEHVDERGYSGAKYMVEAGVLDDVDAAIALHMSPENRVGEIKINDGYSMANVDVFKGKILATGGHGAYPHLGTDPIWMSASVLQALYGITGRRITPLESAVISIGRVQGGTTSNVIPSSMEIEGTIRSYQPEVREHLLKEVENAFKMVKNLGGDYQLQFIEEDPALKNDSEINNIIRKIIENKFPYIQVIEEPFGLGGEDFAHMAKHIPASMFFLGCAIDDGKARNLHTPYFDIDEQVLPIGAMILSEAAKYLLVSGKRNDRNGKGVDL
ncbi:M20 metallopeptidase family protein [Oceanobacillus senegalensis]|uniref:M20 metallopeptidase family protein n=1 Tax=Oceanobacillus senegalensis TaxID=1936063 RepID=UPI001FE864B8|nr:amidohydrolase [Oceanobacillus senegalensis]